MQLRSFLATAAIAFTLVAASPARALRFDVIYTDHIDLTLCDNGCAIGLAGSDFALFVNKSATPIDAATFNSITYTSFMSVPDLKIQFYAFTPGPAIMPIEPNDAVGNISTTYPDNTVLLTQVLPGEVFRDPHSTGTLGFTVTRQGPYEGPVTCTVMMKLGADVATFDIHFDLHLGPHNIVFLSAARASSQMPTPTIHTSWGKIKSLYR